VTTRRRTWIAGVAIVCGLAAARATAPSAAPDFAAVRARHASSEAVLLDRHASVLHERRVDPNGRRLAWVPLAETAPLLVELLIDAEDRRFRTHAGVDPLALAGAARDALRGRVRGASTLTMQLAALLDPALRARASLRGAFAKVRQLRAARALERRWTKDEILEAYLNLATWRGELVGIAAASRGLFDRAPHGLGRAESALLVALLRAPNAAPPSVAARACRLAAASGGCDAIEHAALALAAPPRVRPRAMYAPHLAARLLAAGGPAHVETTLDAALQRRVADVLARQVAALADRNVRDAAALVADNASGEILAWVGGSGAASSARHVDGVRARRQAGSTLKPFLYARAFERRLVTPATRLDDSPLDVVTALGTYRPENYDHAHRGAVAAREALASSLNVPAVRVLQMVGVDDFVALLRGLGIEGLRDADFYGDSLALGSADVSLLELVGAFRALANGGVFTPLRVQPGAAAAGVRVISEAASWLVTDALSDRASRAPTFGLESVLATRRWSAVKTGTSKDMRDNWCIGATRRFTVGVWVGNFSGASMWDVSGIDGAAPAWLEIVESLPAAEPVAAPQPPGLVATRAGVLLAGTEPAPRDLGAAHAPVRIVAPRDRSVLALDPDIPDARERLLFEAASSDPAHAFVLNGRRLGRADAPLLWPLEKGRHTLALIAADGATLDSVGFSVR
jgi:penicillin-binding protein 1C